MINLSLRIFSILTVFVVCTFPASAWAQQRVSGIRVEGTQRIEDSTILSYSGIERGDVVTDASLDDSLKTLYRTGLFADVALRLDGSTVVIKVIENPVINQIVFEGNRRIEDSALLAEIQLRPRNVFTKSKVQDDVARLYQVYRRSGRFSVGIEPKVIKLDQNRVDLVFEMTEGDITKVSSIRFVGNRRFDDDQLRSEISTKESAWYRFLSSDDRYDPDRLSYDQELLRRFYLANGYADFNLGSAVAELSNDRSKFFVTFTVEEGERYRVGDVSIQSELRNFDTSILDSDITIKDGDWYNANRVQEVVSNLTNTLGDNQYAFVTVRPVVNKNRDARTIDLVFQINESPRIFVERINVNGNVRTLDKVIRREMLLVEGDPFNKTKLGRSEQRIRNLDYFETVKVQPKPGSAPDKTVLDIDVIEKSTGELSIGAGFSTNDGPLADFGIRERNLLGRGQILDLGAVIAGERTEFDFSFTEPHFLDRDVAAGLSAFHSTRDYQDESSYDQRRTGAGLHMGYPLSERWRHSLKYRFERNDITDVKNTASRFIQDQEGQRDTSAISQRLTYDNRDSTIFPTDGWLYWLDGEVAGLGGHAKYFSGKTGASYYYPVASRWTLNVMGEVGAITAYGDEDVQINERYFMGGSKLRGFEQAGIGPRDSLTEDSLGGNYFYRSTTELSFPIAGISEDLGVLGHVFNDVGSLWDLDETGAEIQDDSTIRAAAGVGISWRSPFGPIRADFAKPYVKENYDEEEVFRFNFGTRF